MTESNPHRHLLRFDEEVQSAFEFLLARGFRIVEHGVTRVRYESDRVFVTVYHGRSSYEVRFEIGEVGSPAPGYGPEEIAALRCASKDTFFQASTPDRVMVYVRKLAAFLREYGGGMLDGDRFEFARLQSIRDQRSSAVTQEFMFGAARDRAERAWRERNYAAVVDSLSGIGGDLTATEQQRLLYAAKKLKGAR